MLVKGTGQVVSDNFWECRPSSRQPRLPHLQYRRKDAETTTHKVA